MEKFYAQALMKLIQNGMTASDAVSAMHKKLKAEGREALMPRIAKSFSRLATTDMHRTVETLSIADASHEAHARSEAKAGSGVVAVVDSSLIGGWRLEGQERLVDASYKKHLLSLYRRITQSV
jgi:F0F1-type ATP synthase delta subunit